MDILYEVSNKDSFFKNYDEIIDNPKNVSEDSVAYGVAGYIVIGLIFIFEASLSGLTWDYIKSLIIPKINLFLKKKREQDIISIYVEDPEDRYEIEIPDNFQDVNIDIPNKLKIKLKK